MIFYKFFSMRKYLLLFSAFILSSYSYAIGDKVRIGLMVSPGAGWQSPEGKSLKNGGGRFAANYGLLVEYYFKDKNYAFCTGIVGGLDGGKIKDRPQFTIGTIKSSVMETYTTQYIGIPVYLKLKTNPYHDFRFFGQVGFTAVFNVYGRATFSEKIYAAGADSLRLTTAPDIEVTKENILKSDNEVTKAIPKFGYNIFDFRLNVGAGFEYDINDKTAIFFSINYNNGFVNTVKDEDAKKDNIYQRNFLFNIGVLF